MADSYVTREDIANRLGLTARRITQLVREGQLADGTPFPSRVAGKSRTFPSERCFEWYIRFKQEEALQRVAPQKPASLADAELRKALADAELAELKVAERRRAVVGIAAAMRETEGVLDLVRTRVLSLRGRWQPRILGIGTMPEAAATMDALTDDVLAALRDSAALLEDEPTDGVDGDTIGDGADEADEEAA